jgi:adenylate cyclase, class 2
MSKDHYEIEVKVLEVNKKELENKLKEIGAKKLFSDRKVIQENYDNKELKKKNAAIRVRQLGKDLFITYKQFKEIKNNIKSCKEIEFQVFSSDFKAIKDLFKSLGLERYHRIEKTRTTYVLGTTTFDIDTISKPFRIPTYYEIEVKDYKDIDKILKLLKVPKRKALPWGTKKLLKHYANKKTNI